MAQTLKRLGVPGNPAPGPLPPRDPDAYWDESPAQRVWLPRFFIARYPVTVGQWRAYHAATGPPVDEWSLRGEPTHPVENVSWRDAVEYCAWLTEALRGRAQAEAVQPPAVPMVLARLVLEGDGRSGPWAVRLPSEAEWEKAARSDTASVYPWGNELDPNRANYREPGGAALRSTSAVGCFPSGVSPYQVEELAGNVAEWTQSERRPYPYAASDGRERGDVSSSARRVVRGGSFSGLTASVRSADRYDLGPGTRYISLGFRVVVAPCPSDL